MTLQSPFNPIPPIPGPRRYDVRKVEPGRRDQVNVFGTNHDYHVLEYRYHLCTGCPGTRNCCVYMVVLFDVCAQGYGQF